MVRKSKKKLNKVKVIIFFILPLLVTVSVFGRYVYNTLKEKYVTSKAFYFTSNLLQTNNPKYNYASWGGGSITQFTVELYSYENELLKMEYDLNYTLTCESLSDKVTCSIDSNSASGPKEINGVIPAVLNDTASNKMVHVIYVIPNTDLELGEKVSVKVTAVTNDVYEKSISAEFSFTITAQESEYEIEDSIGSKYATLLIRNTTNSNSDVILQFDPKVISLDMNDDIYINRISVETVPINGSPFINSIRFNLQAESSRRIKFYKKDSNKNYTYPNGNAKSIITCLRPTE